MKSHQQYLENEPNMRLFKKLKLAIFILTAVVYTLVSLMRMPQKLDLGIDFTFLPPVHALLNSLVSVCLIIAFITIMMKKVCLHRLFINIAMLLSVLFLFCYVAYHFTTPEVRFPEGAEHRGLYFIILLSHILLAGVSLPLILFTWAYGVTNQFKKHRKFAKWVFPIWLYVAITGPICYFMLKPHYKADQNLKNFSLIKNDQLNTKNIFLYTNY